MGGESQNNELVQEICSFADSNDHHISYTVIADMLTKDGDQIDKKELDQVVERLTKDGCIIDLESEDESYADGE